MAGDSSLFDDQDAVEAVQAVVDPMLVNHHPVLPDAPETWGSREAAALIAGDGGWHNPAALKTCP